jgi:hypothetical protein
VVFAAAACKFNEDYTFVQSRFIASVTNYFADLSLQGLPLKGLPPGPQLLVLSDSCMGIT